MRTFGVAILIAGLIVAALPQVTNCQYDGKALTLTNGRQVPMKCYWTAMAEAGVGGTIAVAGVALAASRRKETTRALTAVGASLGAVTMLLPTVLIGVCGDMTASCNQIMRPSLLLLGGLIIAASLGAFLYAQSRQERLA
jgi:hypothetical protein